MRHESGWTINEQAQKIAKRFVSGSYVNLGIGMPSSIVNEINPDQHIFLHCENGLLGYRALEESEPFDNEIIDAGSNPVGLINGAAVVSHDVSFAIARGGRLDYSVLGAFQVSKQGDLANWKIPSSSIAGVGGAMDLAMGAKKLIVMMKHQEKDGTSKIVDTCTYPLTAEKCVDLIVTQYAVISVTDSGLIVEEMAEGITAEQLQEMTATDLTFSEEHLARMR